MTNPNLLAVVLITLVLGCLAPPVAAQSPPEAAALPAEGPPAPVHAMAAYRTLDEWVRKLAVPETAPADLPPVTGAAVMLRLDGRVVGRGSTLAGLPKSETVWLAAREAIAEARRRTPQASDLLQEEALAGVAARLTISLELAGPLTPILPGPATYADAELILAPGLDGVAVRLGSADEARYGAIFPSQMLSTNVMPHQALAAAASLAAGDATAGVNEPKDLREKLGASLLRFRTTHLAQAGAHEEPIFLTRGMRLVPMTAMSTAGLREMGERIAGRLGVFGSEQGQKPEVEVSSTDALLALAAAERFVAAGGLKDRRAMQGIQNLAMRDIGPERPGPAAGQSDAGRAIDDAMKIIAFDRREEQQRKRKRDRAGGAPAPLPKDVAEIRESIYRLVAADGAVREDVPVGARSILAYALTSIARAERLAGEPLPGELKTIDVAEATIRRLMRETPAEQLVAHMPWLGWAEVRFADLKAEIAGQPPGSAPIPSAVALRRMREQVWSHMLTPADCGPDNADLAGGIVFSKSKVLLPTWQGARPLAFVATMLGDPRLTEPAEFNGELVKLLTALRFLRQLQADEAVAWMAASRELTLGGIRASAWDQRMPIDASAMTLMVVAETLRSLELQAAGGPRAPAGAADPPRPAPPSTR